MQFNFGAGAGRVFRALRHRDYRLFFLGQGVSVIGTHTQYVALSWLVYRLTGSTVLLGAVAFCTQVPTFFLGPLAGVAADRARRKKLLLLTQALSMGQALALAALVLTGAIQTWHILTLGIFIGSVNAFDIPVRQSFVIGLVESRDDYTNAIALNSAMFHGARFIGPAIAAVLISAFEEGVCFLVNGISYAAVLGALGAIRVKERSRRRQNGPMWGDFWEGIQYVRSFKPIAAVLALLSLLSIAGAPYMVLMPAYAKDILHGSANTFGLLMSSAGVGSVCGTLYLASRKDARGLIKIIPAAAGATGCVLTLFALSRSLTLSVFLLFLAGFSMVTQVASSNTFIQTVVDEDKRGRILSLFAMSFMGIMPFGSILAGALAGKIGVPHTLLLGGACCIAGALIFSRLTLQLPSEPKPTPGTQ